MLLIYSIISLRENAIVLLHANVKGYIQRKKMEDYLAKVHCSYKITTCIDNSPNIKMVVYLNNGLDKEFFFEYDYYSSNYALFIPRNTVTESVYKFNFVSNGKIIIDSSFASINDKEKYMNIINFTKIIKAEEEKMQNDLIHIRYIMSILKRKNDDSIFKRSLDYLRFQGSSANLTNDDDGNSDENEEVYKDKEKQYAKLVKKMSSSCIKTVFHKSLTVSKSKEIDIDVITLTRPKSILKNLRRESNNSLHHHKKVSFKKKVEYSI